MDMKAHYIMIAVAALVVSSACTKTNEQPGPEGIQMTFQGNNGEFLAGRIKMTFEGGLPATGLLDYTYYTYVSSYGYYWSSSLNTDAPYYSYYVLFNYDFFHVTADNRFSGQPVRPVSE